MDHFADSFSEEQYCHSLYFHEQNRVIFQEYKTELHGANLKGLKLNCDVELPHQTVAHLLFSGVTVGRV